MKLIKIKSILFLICFSVVIYSCKNNSESSVKVSTDGLIELNNIAGLKNIKELKLSELVDSIEYIKLETIPDALLPRSWFITGEKYIVLWSSQPCQIFLFSRQGEFIRKIGKQGKGPGEYIRIRSIDLSPDENKIIISDNIDSSIKEYNIEGDFIQTIKCPYRIDGALYFLDNNTVIGMQRPTFVYDSVNHARIVTINLETKIFTPLYYFIHEKIPTGNTVYMRDQISRNDDGVFFRDCISDTLYQVLPGLKVKAKVSVYVGSNTSPTFAYPMDKNYDDVGIIHDFPNHLLMIGSYNERFYQFYDKKNGHLFTIPELNNCYDKNKNFYGIINDMDGLKPIWKSSPYYVRNNSIADKLEVIDLKDWSKTECFTNAKLTTNIYRERIKKLAEQGDVDDNPIIRILHLKSEL